MRSKSGSFRCVISSATAAGPLGNRAHFSRYGSTAIGKKRSLFAKRRTGSYFSSNSRSFTWPQLWYKRDMDIQAIEGSFGAYFNAKPEFIVRAPGRVNLIGEHTDYNDGFVLPMAIDRAVWMALRLREDKHVRIYSLDLEAESTFELNSLAKDKGWAEYIKGVAYQLQNAGYELRGFDAVITGDVPSGAGLSSSAAVELASARAFAATSGFAWDASKMALLAQKAENQWVGVNCGIMDQMASAASKEGHALFLDCRSLEYQQVPLPENVSVVILDTSTRRGLVDSSYNERRAQCEQAARWFGVDALRDVTLEEF